MESRSYINLSIGALSLAAVTFIAAASLTLRQALAADLSEYEHQLTMVTVGALLFVAAGALWTHYRLNLMLNRLTVAEMRTSLVFESIRDGIVSTTETGVIVSANAAIEKLTGWRAGDLLGEHISILFPVDAKPDLPLNRILSDIGELRPAQVIEVEIIRREGSRFVAQLSTSVVQEEEGDVLYTMVVRDVTENVRARAELESRVRERTAEIAATNVELADEIEHHKRTEAERQQTVSDLKEALTRLKVLSGLLPICAHCKKIRDDKGYWNQIEVYLSNHSHAEFSHGICPDCMQQHFPSIRKMPESATQEPNCRDE